MQRLGFIKYIVYKCSFRNSSSVDGIGRDLLDSITKKIPVSPDQKVIDYIRLRLTSRIYRDIREIIKKMDKGGQASKPLYLELQDTYLSSENIPSKTGKLSLQDMRKYSYFAASLGMIRKEVYSLLVRGKVLLEFTDREEIEAFNQPNISVNPLLLTAEQKTLFLYSLLGGDGDVLNPLYAELIKNEGNFSDRNAGNYLPSIYREIAKSFSSRTRTGIDKDKLERLRRSADTIESWKGKPYSGMEARGAAITIRLEPFVDLGLLEKQNPYKYEYRLSESGKKLFNLFCSNEDIGQFLDGSFFSSLNKSFNYGAKPAEEAEIMEVLFSAFDRIKSPLGYAPIKEIALLGAIKSLVNNRKYFEIDQATGLIAKYQESHPYAVRFQVDRSGVPVYVKFLSKVEKL